MLIGCCLLGCIGYCDVNSPNLSMHGTLLILFIRDSVELY